MKLTVVLDGLGLVHVLVLWPTVRVDHNVRINHLSSLTASRGLGESLTTDHLTGERRVNSEIVSGAEVLTVMV